MENETIQSKLALQGDDIPQFRMRIAHFFLLTTVCAIISTIKISWIDWKEIPNDAVGFFKLQVALVSLLDGAAVTALLILLSRRWRFGRSELRSPGHWLLVFLATGTLIQGITGVLLEIFRYYNDSSNISFDAWNLEKLLLCSTVGITCFIFAWLISGNFWWKSILVFPGIVLLALVPQPAYIGATGNLETLVSSCPRLCFPGLIGGNHIGAAPRLFVRFPPTLSTGLAPLDGSVCRCNRRRD